MFPGSATRQGFERRTVFFDEFCRLLGKIEYRRLSGEIEFRHLPGEIFIHSGAGSRQLYGSDDDAPALPVAASNAAAPSYHW